MHKHQRVRSRTQEAENVTWLGFVLNVFLTAFKLFAGIVGNSAAMIADGVHSFSDFVTDIIVVAFMRVSGKKEDEAHPYGHGKYETFATFIISAVLFVVGLGLFYEGVDKIIRSIRGEILPQPEMIAFWAAVISIILKESLYQYTVFVAKKINSKAVMANAWHHRSDAFSSIAVGIGIIGAIFLGENWRILDPIACVFVSFFILRVALELGYPSIKELLETSLPKQEIKNISEILMNNAEVLSYHKLRTRKIGNAAVIDVHVQMNADISFVRSHKITQELAHELQNLLGEETQVNIHTEPAKA